MSRMMHLFRKYQYLLLVFFGVLLMIVFVVGDALQSYMQNRGDGGGGSEADPVVLTWREGKITSSDLYSMRVKHAILMEFLNDIVQETTRREGSPKGFGVVPARNDEDLVRKILLAAKAESMGLVVDNDAAQAFLRQLSDNLLDGPDFDASYDKAVRGRITQQHLMDQLKRELMADQLMMMSRAGLFVLPPHEAWEMHNRLHRRVQTELALLKVDDFKAKVTGQPSEVQITALYEQGKDEYPYPSSPDPGFKRRRQVNFAFVKADLNKFTEDETAKIAPTITDAEIEEHYNKNKERYRVLDLPGLPGTTEPGAAEPAKPADAGAAPTGDKPPEPAPTPEAKPADGTEGEKKDQPPASTEEKPAAEEKPATEEQKTPENKPVEKAEDKPSEKSTTEAQPPADKQGSLSERAKFTLVAFQEPEAPKADPAAPAEASQPAAPVETPPTPEKADNAAPAATPPVPETTPAPENPPANPKQPATTTDTQPPTTETPPAGAETPPVPPTGTASAEKKEEPKYKPLDDKLRTEIRDEIARERARRAAQEQADKGIEVVQSVIDQHGRKLRTMEIAEDATPSVAPPDYEQAALEHGLVVGETGLVDELGIQKFELGETTEFSMSPAGGIEQVPFSQFGFDPTLQPYRPQRIRDFVAQRDFLYWVVDSKPEYVPELKDIRDEVIDKWKQQEAFLMAKAEADKFAKELAGDKPLAESLKDRAEFTVSQPPPFSWMSTGFTPFGSSNAPALSNVAEVEGINDEFMRSIFELNPSHVGVAVNQPQTAVYLVRLISASPSEEVLREQFLASGVTNEIQHLALVETNDLWLGWYADLEREFQVEWKN